ncbi:MAG: J domain-containing protein [Hydrogenobaculum sp.]
MGFHEKIVDYIYQNRLSEFQSSFFNLYREYRYLNEEEFIKEWFDKFIIKTLYKYMPYTKLVECFDRYCSLRKNITKSYVSTYWRFCRNPKGFSSKISDSMKFFGLEELDEDRLKKAYRKMMKEYHPDKVKDKKISHEKTVLINYHYQVLLSYLNGLKS